MFFRPLKSRKSLDVVSAFESCVAKLTKVGFKPRVIRLDNEVLGALISTIQQQKMSYRLVPPGNHRTNPAEAAICGGKAHIIAGLQGAHSSFPEQDWDLALPGAELTYNMVRPSRLNPRISAHAQLYGEYNFSSNPLAPFGCEVIIHDRPQEQGAWANRGTEGWYIHPTLNHYRCYVCMMKSTKAERISDTVEFFPEEGMPTTSATDRFIALSEDLIEIIQNPPPAGPFLDLGTQDNDAVRRLSKIFQLSAPRVDSTSGTGATTGNQRTTTVGNTSHSTSTSRSKTLSANHNHTSHSTRTSRGNISSATNNNGVRSNSTEQNNTSNGVRRIKNIIQKNTTRPTTVFKCHRTSLLSNSSTSPSSYVMVYHPFVAS